MTFEAMLEKLEPMISAHMRKLHIYKEHEQFRQSARVAIWRAWQRFDAEKGDFEPYAFQTIRGALLDELKMSARYEERFVPTEDDALYEQIQGEGCQRTRDFVEFLAPHTTPEECMILHAYYIEGYDHTEIAAMLGMSRAALQKKKSRLLIRLRKEMSRP
ncbi:sigma-70 family RNA polymerase sigma factor [Kurthia gibsonii]|uniref:sigma-70 family RNA polymerase sigma factor n=1 Tax=Kurthia gibsonii TaxID=33946 RepID=UPI001144D9E5|nr:sigma-70 family RNA polymerase sigma factor [Kurthia gibsonii]GED20865.1 hypothetical protein KGI01_26060 [Kurthia gibsonii]